MCQNLLELGVWDHTNKKTLASSNAIAMIAERDQQGGAARDCSDDTISDLEPQASGKVISPIFCNLLLLRLSSFLLFSF